MLSWRRHTVRLAAGVILCVLYLGYFFWLTDETAAGRLVALSPAAAAWLPNYLIAVVAITWMAQARWFRARSVPDRRG
jgi:lipopolysaccharide export LptBFGC system permease protein LptF